MILISAGHHPSKPGACHEGFCEFDEASIWADKICELLGGKAMRVPNGVLREKVAFINARSPTIAAEIHFNAAQIWKDLNANGVVDEGEMRNVGRGALTLYYPGSTKGRILAESVQEGMEQIFDRHWNGVMEGYYRMNKRYGPDYFLARTRCPSIIIEPEFIHRKDLITSKRDAACASIASSLLDAERRLKNVS